MCTCTHVSYLMTQWRGYPLITRTILLAFILSFAVMDTTMDCNCQLRRVTIKLFLGAVPIILRLFSKARRYLLFSNYSQNNLPKPTHMQLQTHHQKPKLRVTLKKLFTAMVPYSCWRYFSSCMLRSPMLRIRCTFMYTTIKVFTDLWWSHKWNLLCRNSITGAQYKSF